MSNETNEIIIYDKNISIGSWRSHIGHCRRVKNVTLDGTSYGAYCPNRSTFETGKGATKVTKTFEEVF
jgi:hypothetical protein